MKIKILYLHACCRAEGMLPGEHYTCKTLVRFVVHFIFQKFKNIDFYIKIMILYLRVLESIPREF